MKTQLSKPARAKASYSGQYKEEALELWRVSARSAAKVAAELGIRPPLPRALPKIDRVLSSVDRLVCQNCPELFFLTLSEMIINW